jgi:sorbitol/mannitol transport system substrate-binding protein
VYGICLRGKPGWGDNMAFLTTMVNTNGGQWFDMSVEAAAGKQALARRHDLLRRYAQEGLAPRDPRPTASTRSWRCINEGKCAACGWTRRLQPPSSATPSSRKVADKVAFAQAPTATTTAKGANWLWAWNAGHSGQHEEGCGRAEIRQLGDVQGLHPTWWPRRTGWAHGAHRHAQASTYATPEFQKVCQVFAAAEKKAIDSANLTGLHAAQVARTRACSSRRFRSSSLLASP